MHDDGQTMVVDLLQPTEVAYEKNGSASLAERGMVGGTDFDAEVNKAPL